MAASQAKPGPGVTKQAVEELGRDILPLHAQIRDLHTATPLALRAWLPWMFLLIPPLGYGSGFWLLRTRRRLETTAAAIRAKRAAKTFAQQCRHETPSARELTAALRQYLNERFHLRLGTLTPEETGRILRARGVREASVRALQGIQQELEAVVYTGRGEEACGKEEDLVHLIQRIEKEIR